MCRPYNGDSSEHAIPHVSSLGFLLVLENPLRIACGGDAQRFRGPPGDLTAEFDGLFFRGPKLVSFFIVLALSVRPAWIMRPTRIGRRLRAISGIPDAVAVLALETGRAVPVVFMLPGLPCRLAGALFTVNWGEVSPRVAVRAALLLTLLAGPQGLFGHNTISKGKLC